MVCEHKWLSLETKYIYLTRSFGSSTFKRIDRFFCEKCCEQKEVTKECKDYEDRKPEWFDFKNYQTIHER